jgi:hypothetical protein
MSNNEAKSNVQADLVEAIMKSVPYPQHIHNIDFSEPDVIRLEWRGDKFRVTERMSEEIDDSMLKGSNIAILFETLVHRGLVAVNEERSKRGKVK